MRRFHGAEAGEAVVGLEAADGTPPAAMPALRVSPADGSRASEFMALAVAAAVPALAWWSLWVVLYGQHNFNDFHDFWLAAKLITMGRSPYDIHALQALADAENLHFVLGGGYLYPLPFAVAMVPFTALPFATSVLVFNYLSLALFGLTVSAWFGWAHGWAPELRRRRFALAAVAGLYPPVYGTIANGQANLVLLPLTAAGVVLALDGHRLVRRGAGGVLIGLAAIVKLVPGVLILPLFLGRRIEAAVGIVAGALGALVAANLIAPFAGNGDTGYSYMFNRADEYFTNQSFNGFVTRLVTDSDRTVALWPGAFDARLPMMAVTVAFGLATVAVLWRYRSALATRRGLALGLGFALVAGIAGAPKNSFWNQTSSLLAVGLILSVEAPDLRLSRLGRTNLILLGCWLAGAAVFTLFWTWPPPKSSPLAPAFTILESSSLFGLLAIWWLFVRLLRRPEVAAAPGRPRP